MFCILNQKAATKTTMKIYSFKYTCISIRLCRCFVVFFYNNLSVEIFGTKTHNQILNILTSREYYIVSIYSRSFWMFRHLFCKTLRGEHLFLLFFFYYFTWNRVRNIAHYITKAYIWIHSHLCIFRSISMHIYMIQQKLWIYV